MRDDLVAYFESHHKLVEAGALQLLLHAPQPLQLSRRVIEAAGADSPFVTLELVERVLGAPALPSTSVLARPATPARGDSAPGGSPKPSYELVREGFIPPEAAREPLEAFQGLFRSRYAALARLLKGRPELENLRPIGELWSAEGVASVIGMIREVRETAQRHQILLKLEDETGAVDALLPKGDPAARTVFLPDEVVGLRLRLGRERGQIARILAVQRPDVPSQRTARRSPASRRVLFLSDLHVGSRSFLSEPWNALVGFLRGDGPEPELAASVAHVVVAGDLVDGIGVYPNQERDLAVHDVFQQYEELGRRLAELPSRLNIVVVPGNHDAVCPAEPQPSLPKELSEGLPGNVRSLGNPSTFALEGVVVEAYHGRSFDDLIPAIPGATYARPTDVMKRMLLMRHLGPIYGGRTPMAPLARDGLVIDPAPEILVTGHAHTYGVDQYRGTLLLNASTWQAETEYQRMRNIAPVPARAALVDLSDLALTTLDFSSGSLHVGSRAA